MAQIRVSLPKKFIHRIICFTRHHTHILKGDAYKMITWATTGLVKSESEWYCRRWSTWNNSPEIFRRQQIIDNLQEFVRPQFRNLNVHQLLHDWSMKKTYLLLFFSAFICLACSKDSDDPELDCSTPKSFTTDVHPVIQSTCAINSGCHGTGSNTNQGPGPLTSYAEIFPVRDAIYQAVRDGTMPKTGSLTPAQKNALLCWISSGAPNN